MHNRRKKMVLFFYLKITFVFKEKNAMNFAQLSLQPHVDKPNQQPHFKAHTRNQTKTSDDKLHPRPLCVPRPRC